MRAKSNGVYFGDNMDVLPRLPTGSVNLIYVDPPFNTGKVQKRNRIEVARDINGSRFGFAGLRYASKAVRSGSYQDRFVGENGFEDFIGPRLEEARRILAADGSIYAHLNYSEVHYCKVLLDEIFGRECFKNEIIWAYDYGGRGRTRWPAKHDNILFYVKDPKRYTFNRDAIERIPYMAPGLVTKEKAKRGKLPTDTWWHTIVATNSKEKTGYPTQKPLGVLRRIVLASSNPGDLVLDFFAGSGTTGVAAHELGRRFILIDNNPQAIEVMKKRLAGMNVKYITDKAMRARPGKTGRGTRLSSRETTTSRPPKRSRSG